MSILYAEDQNTGHKLVTENHATLQIETNDRLGWNVQSGKSRKKNQQRIEGLIKKGGGSVGGHTAKKGGCTQNCIVTLHARQ